MPRAKRTVDSQEAIELPVAVAHVQGFPAPAPLDLVLERGEALCLRGPSGSGKTSFLRALAGLPAALRPRRVQVEGSDPATWRASRLGRTIGFVPQEASDGLVGLTVAGEYRFRGRSVPDDHQDVATLSSGEARRLVLDLAAKQPILLLDEPAEGLDEAGVAALRRTIRHRQGTVVFVDHDGRLQDLATRTVDLGLTPPAPVPELPPAGRVVVQAPAAQVRRGERLLGLPGIEARGLHLLRGPNGCGKTTLLRRLAGLDAADVLVDAEPPVPGRTTRWSSARARDHLTRTTVAQELDQAEAEIMDALVPPALALRHPLHLSGGEAQRIALAKALGRPARAYLLDEPEAHLDGAGRGALLAAIAHRIRQGAAVVVASHDPTWQDLAHGQTTWDAPRDEATA